MISGTGARPHAMSRGSRRVVAESLGDLHGVPAMPIRVSDSAVQAATGKRWDEWLRILAAAEATPAPHREIVAYLGDAYGLSPWWRQQVALVYEEARGRRTLGSSASAGYQVGARRALPVTPEVAWELLTSPRGVAAWLGETLHFQPDVGQVYRTAGGATGEYRVVKPMRQLRLTWLPAGWAKPSTIQVRLLPAGPEKTVVSFHQENLPDQISRLERRRHWLAALDSLAEMSASTAATPGAP